MFNKGKVNLISINEKNITQVTADINMDKTYSKCQTISQSNLSRFGIKSVKKRKGQGSLNTNDI